MKLIRSDRKALYAFMAPAIIVMILFFVIPVLYVYYFKKHRRPVFYSSKRLFMKRGQRIKWYIMHCFLRKNQTGIYDKSSTVSMTKKPRTKNRSMINTVIMIYRLRRLGSFLSYFTDLSLSGYFSVKPKKLFLRRSELSMKLIFSFFSIFFFINVQVSITVIAGKSYFSIIFALHTACTNNIILI